MCHQIQGEIEGCDAGNRTDRKSFDDAPAAGRGLLPVERKILAVAADRFFGGDVKSEDGAVDLHARALDRLAGLLREGARKFILAIANSVGNAAQNTLALEGGQAAGGSERLDRCGNGELGVLTASLANAGDHRTVVRSMNFDDVTFIQPLAIHVKAMGCNWNHRHLHHASPPRGRSKDYRTLEQRGGFQASAKVRHISVVSEFSILTTEAQRHGENQWGAKPSLLMMFTAFRVFSVALCLCGCERGLDSLYSSGGL